MGGILATWLLGHPPVESNKCHDLSLKTSRMETTVYIMAVVSKLSLTKVLSQKPALANGLTTYCKSRLVAHNARMPWV